MAFLVSATIIVLLLGAMPFVMRRRETDALWRDSGVRRVMLWSLPFLAAVLLMVGLFTSREPHPRLVVALVTLPGLGLLQGLRLRRRSTRAGPLLTIVFGSFLLGLLVAFLVCATLVGPVGPRV